MLYPLSYGRKGCILCSLYQKPAKLTPISLLLFNEYIRYLSHMNRLLRTTFTLVLATGFFAMGSKAVFAAGVINIGSITATPSDTSFTAQWTTAVPASSMVTYGTTTSYGSSTTEADVATRVTQHSVTVTGLAACTTYHFQVTSNALSYSETTASSADQQVTTAGCAAVATPVAATAVPLATTGDNTPIYLSGIGAMLLMILAITQLKRAGY
jgi:hypothetical protein